MSKSSNISIICFDSRLSNFLYKHNSSPFFNEFTKYELLSINITCFKRFKSNKSPKIEAIFNKHISSASNSLLIISPIFFYIILGIFNSVKSLYFIISPKTSVSFNSCCSIVNKF